MSSVGKLRVAIVGAGPSGLTLAYYLKALGLKSVEFFEAQHEVGGQSVTIDVDDVPVELGTVYLTDGYVLARHVAASVGCPAKVLPEATVLDDDGNKIDPDSPRASLLIRYLRHWFWWYLGGQMRAPSRPENALTFGDWLRRKGLGDLAEGFAFSAGLTAQLYGPIEDISAHSGLNWMRPSLFLTARLKDTARIPQGFQTMWKNLQAALGFTFNFNVRIKEVRPIRDGDGYRVELHHHGGQVDGPFDHVFIACPLDFMEDHPLKDVTKTEGSPEAVLDPIQHPLSAALRTHYSPFAATEVYSGAWKAKNWPDFAPSRCYLPAASRNQRGPLLTIRRYDTRGGKAIGQFCSYAIPKHEDDEQRVEDNASRLKSNHDRVVRDMREIVKLQDVEIIEPRLWRYNNRFSQAQLAEGLPLYIEAAQGRQNVWYTGGTMSHWNIDAITDYSLYLARRFAKQTGQSLFTRLRLLRIANLISDF